jgi:hypothetical protein
MSALLSVSSGDWTNSSSWGGVEPNSFLNSETLSVNLTSTYQSSSDLGFQLLPSGTVEIQGIAVKVASRATTPVGDSVLRLRIRNNSPVNPGVVVEVTVSVNRVAAVNSTLSFIGNTPYHWIYLSITPVTITTGGINDLYVLEAAISGSGANQISLLASGGTNWTRALVTTTPASPSSGDTMIIVGKINGTTSAETTTITFDDTSGIFYGTSVNPSIEVGNGGVMNFGVNPNTNYILNNNGIINIGGGGTISVGTSISPMAYGATATIFFNQSTPNLIQLNVRQNGNLITYGATKSGRGLLGVSAATSSTTLYTKENTDWLLGDNLVIAGTTCSINNLDFMTLTTNASATAVSFSPAISRNKTVWPNTEVEILNLTRNVRIFGTSLATWSLHQYTGNCVVNINNTEFRYSGLTNSVDNSPGPVISVRGSSFWDLPQRGILYEPSNLRSTQTSTTGGLSASLRDGTLIFDDVVCYNCNSFGFIPITARPNSVTFSNVWAASASSVWFVLTGNGVGSNLTNGIVIDRCRLMSSLVGGLSLSSLVSSASGRFDIVPLKITNSVFKNNLQGMGQFSVGSFTTNGRIHDISENKFYFNTLHGVNLSPSGIGVNGYGWIFGRFEAFSNGVANLNLLTTNEYTFLGATLYGGPTGPAIPGLTASRFGIFYGGLFGGTFENIYMFGHSSDVIRTTGILLRKIDFRNSFFGSSQSLIQTGGFYPIDSVITSSRHNQIDGNNIIMTRLGTMSSDFSIFRTTPNSFRVRPTVLGGKFESTPILIPAKTGQTINVGVWVRTSILSDGAPTYSGNFPRLLSKSNTANGTGGDDYIIATASLSSSGSWEYISGNLPASLDDTAFEVVVDCDGITGWINIDDMYVSSQNSTKGLKYWFNGSPVPSSTTQNGNFVVL